MGQQQGYAAARMHYYDQTSCAMNYYEELGVSQEATGEEIRKAHRRLVKLMHPDAQLDQGLKNLAETQMRRLNSIVSTLLDADQRRAYDNQLRSDLVAGPILHDRGHWRGLPWWLLSAAGAVVLTLVAVWLWADHLSNSFTRSSHTIYVRPADKTPEAEIQKQPAPATDTAPSAKIEDAHNDFPAPPADLHEAPYAQQTAPSRDSSGGVSARVIQPDAHTTSTVEVPTPKPVAKVKAPPVPVPAFPIPVPKASPKPPAHHDTAVVANRAPTIVAPPPVVVKPKPSAPSPSAGISVAAPPENPKKSFNLPDSEVVARAETKPAKSGSSVIPPPPGISPPAAAKDETEMAAAGAPPPAPAPRPEPVNIPTRSGAGSRPRDPLEGEWVYAPKEPERRKPGFYPPEFIDLKLFSSGDSGSLRGQYNARYVITDKPISPEVSFNLASVDKESHKFTWQSSNGAKGTVAIHPVDDNTIRIEWHTTGNVKGPSLTSGAATLVRRQ